MDPNPNGRLRRAVGTLLDRERNLQLVCETTKAELDRVTQDKTILLNLVNVADTELALASIKECILRVRLAATWKGIDALKTQLRDLYEIIGMEFAMKKKAEARFTALKGAHQAELQVRCSV